MSNSDNTLNQLKAMQEDLIRMQKNLSNSSIAMIQSLPQGVDKDAMAYFQKKLEASKTADDFQKLQTELLQYIDGRK